MSSNPQAKILLDQCSARTKALLEEAEALRLHLRDLYRADRRCCNRLQRPAGDLGHEMVARHAEMLVVAEHYKAAIQNFRNIFMGGELAKDLRGCILKSAGQQGGGSGPYRLPQSKDYYVAMWGTEIGKTRVERIIEKVLRWAEKKGWQVEFAEEGENVEVDGEEAAKEADGEKTTDEVEE